MCALVQTSQAAPLPPLAVRKQQLLLFSILCFSTCQVLIDWLQWIRAAVLLQSARAQRINTFICESSRMQARDRLGVQSRSPNPLLSHFIFSLVFSLQSLLSNFSATHDDLEPNSLFTANVAVGECKGAIMRQSHPACRSI